MPGQSREILSRGTKYPFASDPQGAPNSRPIRTGVAVPTGTVAVATVATSASVVQLLHRLEARPRSRWRVRTSSLSSPRAPSLADPARRNVGHISGLDQAQEQGVRIDSGVQLLEVESHGTDQVRSDGMGEASTPRGGRAAAHGTARAGRGHAANPHDAGLHHGGRQPARGARPELPARLLAAGWHARHGLRVLERLAMVRRRLRIQPRVGLRAIPGDPVQWPAGPDHELRPTLRGPDGHLLGRALLGSALSRPPLVPPASAERMGPSSPAAAASQASVGVGASAPTAAFRKPAAAALPSSLGSAAAGSAGQQPQVRREHGCGLNDLQRLTHSAFRLGRRRTSSTSDARHCILAHFSGQLCNILGLRKPIPARAIATNP